MKLFHRLLAVLRAHKFQYGLLVAIFFLALFLRVNQLGQMPSGFHRDEVISGYVGRFILQNGKDPYGNFLPLLYFDKYGDFPPVLPMYLSGLSTLIFGVTVFATRLPISLLGALQIFLIYCLAKELFNDKRIALFSAFILSILPWHIVLSRSTAEGIVALTAGMGGLYYLLKFLKGQRGIFLVISVLLFLLTYLLYPSYRVLVPLLFLPLPFIFSLKQQGRVFLFAALAFFIIVTLLISSTVWGKGRFNQTSLFGKDMIQSRIQILANEEGPNNVGLVKIFHNKYILEGKEFISLYLAYFSPEYLFTNGGLPYRYSVSDEGLLYLIMIPLLLFSVFSFSTIERRTGIFLLYLLIISPMPSPLTVDDVPNVHRTLFMVIPFTLLASYGFIMILNKLKSNRMRVGFTVGIIAVFSIELIYFSHMYYHHANAVKSIERGDTNKEVIQAVIAQKDRYDSVYLPVNDAFAIYYLYFTNQFQPSLIGKIQDRLIVDKLDNLTFTRTNCPSEKLSPSELQRNILVVDSTDCEIPPQMKKIQQFSRHDGTTSYRFLVSEQR